MMKNSWSPSWGNIGFVYLGMVVTTSGLAGDATVSEGMSADKFHGKTLNVKVNTFTNGGGSFDLTCIGLGSPSLAQ